MDELKNWTEITKEFYRYAVSASVCYEIMVRRHYHNEDILSAIADIYVTGNWRDNITGKNFFEREALNELGNGISVYDCLLIAKRDYEENCM